MIVLMLVFLGLVLGSFVNAVVWRLHENKNWINDRSECTHCHHKLKALDLIPVVSWAMLRGKCRYCHKKIEDSPLAELALPALFVISYLLWPATFESKGLIEFIFWLVFLTGFLILALYDLRWFLLPNKVVFPLIALAAIQVLVVSISQDNFNILLSAAGGALVIAGIFYVLFQLSNGTWIGGGDVKLGVVLGLLAGGVLEGFLVLFFASVAGLLATLPLIVQGKAKRNMQIPFGPFLMAGLFVVVLFGSAIVNWYGDLIYG
ncbi:MAG TPA: prepilin peptidase [Candidatus Saccharimonadales bacterium]|nr:prepilin peptidase [Candidatus Saccharimonadales bacterium]